MSPDRYYVADLREGPRVRRLYFYASTEGLRGSEYGYAEDDSWIDSAFESVVYEVREKLSLQPWGYAAEAGAEITVSEPREISPAEAIQQAPRVNTHVIKAIDLAKREVGKALHPIRVTWHWEISEEWGDDASAYLILTDDAATCRQGFGLQQLEDEALMKDRIRRLYQDLLAKGTREIIKNFRRTGAGAGRD